RERVQLVDHRVDGLLQLQDLAPHVDGDLLGQVAARDRDRDVCDVAHLSGQVARHRVHVVGEVLPRAGHAEHLRLAAALALVADPLAFSANAFSWSTIVLIVFLSSRISPCTSTVILRDRSPRATAVVTSAMLRTWPVRLLAIELTLSVRSFHVPAMPGTFACPPRRPSVPTSRATRVTSPANAFS